MGAAPTPAGESPAGPSACAVPVVPKHRAASRTWVRAGMAAIVAQSRAIVQQCRCRPGPSARRPWSRRAGERGRAPAGERERAAAAAAVATAERERAVDRVKARATGTRIRREAIVAGVLFAELAAASEDVRAVSGRREKVERLAAALRALAPEERAAGAGYLAGAPRQRVLGVGWAALREPPPPAAEPSLTVAEVDGALAELSALAGAGSPGARREALTRLLARATASEQAFLTALILGDLRQGALAAVVGDAVARAAGVPVTAVRRALMLRGDLGAVAETALASGDLGAFRLRV